MHLILLPPFHSRPGPALADTAALNVVQTIDTVTTMILEQEIKPGKACGNQLFASWPLMHYPPLLMHT